MALSTISFKKEGEIYVSDTIEVQQTSVGLQMQFAKGGIMDLSISYDNVNFHSFESRNYEFIFARPVVGLSADYPQYLKLRCTTEPVSAQYTVAE